MTIHDPAADKAAIKSLYNEWKVPWESGDALAIGHYYTADSVQIPLNEREIIGREAFEHTLREFFNKSIIKNYSHMIEEVEVSADLGYAKGGYTWTIAPKSGEMARRYEGKFVHILKRGQNGRWRIFRAIGIEDREVTQ